MFFSNDGLKQCEESMMYNLKTLDVPIGGLTLAGWPTPSLLANPWPGG
jgi:hypothetical protein